MTARLDFALGVAREAGALLRKLSHQGHEIGHKSTEIDLVTEADLASEKMIVRAIRERFPEHAILSEEGLGDLQQLAGETAHLWLVDPLDGTVNYAHGYPAWGVSLALADHGTVVLAVTYDPLRDEMFWAERGQGAWLDGQRLQVSSADHLQKSLVATGFAYSRASLEDNNLAEFGAIMPRVQGVRRAGAAVLDLSHLAMGRLDGYWEMHLNPWDWGAGWLLIEEAGGKVTDFQGNPWALQREEMVASNGVLHQELLGVLQAVRQSQVSGV
ncbi:MAG: inositol monophosphatase family protein [Anaerolineae bacterium]